jgi:hypothetical protein
METLHGIVETGLNSWKSRNFESKQFKKKMTSLMHLMHFPQTIYRMTVSKCKNMTPNALNSS